MPKATSRFIGPVELKCANFGVDTLLINCKFAGDDLKPNAGTLPEPVAGQLDDWQAVARKKLSGTVTKIGHKPAQQRVIISRTN
jgi:hypothetical protein